MEKLIGLVCCFVAALTVIVPSHGNAEVVSENYHLRGPWAFASVWHSDGGCVTISASVNGGNHVSHLTGEPPVERGYTNASVWGYNSCTVESFHGWVQTDVGPTINAFDSATFSIPVDLYKTVCVPNPDPLFPPTCTETFLESTVLTANLTGTGSIYRTSSMNHSSYGPYRYFSRSNGKVRNADVTMSLITEEYEDLLAGSQAGGQLQNVNSGSYSWYRY